jgi:hypothetical protein
MRVYSGRRDGTINVSTAPIRGATISAVSNGNEPCVASATAVAAVVAASIRG